MAQARLDLAQPVSHSLSRLKPLPQDEAHALRAWPEPVRDRQHPGGGEFH